MKNQLLPQTPTFSYFSEKKESLATLLTTPQFHSTTLITMQQVHGNNWAYINSPQKQPIAQVDALITDNPNLTLAVRTADCVPIVFYHPLSLVGVIHAGRKGLEKGIVKKVFSEVVNRWQLSEQKEQICIWIGPHICTNCYQIDQASDTHYDLRATLISQLNQSLSTQQYQLITDDRCTVCHNDQLYSYRAEGPGVPMNYTAISLKKLS